MAHLFICAECSSAFTPKRSDAETCSDACRARRYRRVHRAKVERLERLVRDLAAAAA